MKAVCPKLFSMSSVLYIVQLVAWYRSKLVLVLGL